MSMILLAKKSSPSVWFLGIVLAGLLLSACQPQAEILVDGEDVALIDTALAGNRRCAGRFVRHELDHITTNEFEPIDMYDSNGAGLAVNDLDGDGDLDVVLADLAGPNNIFWNDGKLNFRKQSLDHGSSRAVAIVDVDADGRLDIVFTTRVGSLTYWRNVGAEQFERVNLPGVQEHAYAMAWADMDNDGDLDVVTGSYDTALELELRDAFMFGDGAGVFIFNNISENGAVGFEPQRLADTSQALALQLFDVNMDGRKDILVGNDFDSVRDAYFLSTAGEPGWRAAEPFGTTTQNTMSFDVGDVNNDGLWELFAADMHPMSDDEQTMYEWQVVIDMMMEMEQDPNPDNPQIMANVLQSRDKSGQFIDMASGSGIAYTGWSWSSKFGDLDQDGFLDLYVVNGMATSHTFGHLPNNELVEENQVLRNDGQGGFVPEPAWGLNDTAGGRSMSMADLDGDGDLDVIINNLLSPAVVLENQLCRGTSVLVDLEMPGTVNRFAVGAVATLNTSSGNFRRDVRVGSGYLSGDPTRLHFGVPQDAMIHGLTIDWPDGQRTQLTGLAAGRHLTITRQKPNNQ